MPHEPEPSPDLLIGEPERDSAQEALEEHLAEKRLPSPEYERRVAAVQRARTRSELALIFADLPLPHPELPPSAPPDPDEDNPPPIFLVGVLTLALGLPVAVVLGFAYGLWWTLALPVVATVAMAYVEHLRSR
ncbi:DUF1707 domain-containing protein [Actinoplanes sp. NPDC048988]|uniref:DUF1707 SHOCT-like domain-containing protein n=1 Tax=Actinoplanes sp. NPDC048988 TaxID=3363901 RepID=UPI00371F0420